MTNKVNKTLNPVDLENGKANKIDKALEELKEAISKSLGKITCVNDVNKLNFKLMDVRIAAQHLVNALEVEKNMPNPKPKIDMKEECVDPVSIWKDVSELPEICGAYFIKWKNLSGIQIGYFYAGNKTFYQNSNYNEGDELNKRHMEKCCLLTDFINSFEQMQKDIEEFKRK